MIDIWILTVVVFNSGVTSYQLKFYSEQEDLKEDELQNTNMGCFHHVMTTIIKTQEQKLN